MKNELNANTQVDSFTKEKILNAIKETDEWVLNGIRTKEEYLEKQKELEKLVEQSISVGKETPKSNTKRDDEPTIEEID